MSFGDGDLHVKAAKRQERVDSLEVTNGKLCDETNRQERRIRQLEALVRDWQELYENQDYGECCRLMKRMDAMGIEVD